MKKQLRNNGLIDLSLSDGLNVDKWLFAGILMILTFSVFVVFSASNENAEMIRSHFIKSGVAVCLFVFVSRVNVIYIKQLAPKLYILTVLLLICVSLFGDVRLGARRWLDLGFMSFQPSELAKLTVPMACALVVAYTGVTSKLKNIGLLLLLTAVPCYLILIQPDLGTCLLVAFSGVAILFFSGLPWKMIIGALLGVGGASPLIWEFVLMPYQKERIITVFNPAADPLGSGYHVLQAAAAIGSGGLTGKGWLEGTQTHLGFIPEQHTDFIFAVIGEELGFLGYLTMMFIYLFILLRLAFIMNALTDIYAKAFTGGIMSIMFAYIFVNVGMVSGMLPVVGVPLPLISYGGTATLSLIFSLGLISGYSKQTLI
ncbi:rod shape-determining protein RodA [Photobacterium kishitanii]|uniref:Cell wall polymerase n=1 Tax=Photobacterium kishitanii TaxID=318456 RepID=A0A2T3KM74_9GAMM|nr:rod shape-determining protein RodA [Photobacterium kishitanii]PSV00907.1 rod shape-determining protein RodA [Photobacterium kishitanii]